MLISSLYSFEIRKEKNGPENLRYGDIMLTEAQRRRIDLPRNASRKLRAHFRREAITMPWINAVVPYTLSPKFGLMEKMTIQKAMRKIEKVSCFKFKQRSLEIDYLTILPLDGCYSYVGRIGGAQDLSLSRGCMYEFIIIHELLHAIGFEHEHQRFDRDNFIQIVYKNIEPSQYHNFDKVNIHEVTTFNYKYDLKSIMHYDETAFGKVNHITKKKLVTMIPLDKSISLDDNLKLSSWDIEKLNIAGNCQSKEIENVVITEKGILKKHLKMLCYLINFISFLQMEIII
uniref:Metalloendopeptidase n=1 Tax=Parastrongyloides trichosuri TaxID=131310 RepID=A0A0N4ZBZ7_PARTI